MNPNLAVGCQPEYTEEGAKEFRNNIFQHVIRGGPAGGGYSTAEDLVRFAEALKSGKLVSSATFDLMTTAKPEVSSPGHGFGFEMSPDHVVGHSVGHSSRAARLRKVALNEIRSARSARRTPRYGARGGTTGGAAIGRRAVDALVADGRSESNTGRRGIRTGESEAAAALEAGYTMVIVSV